MATISRAKEWITGDTLTAADLNAEFDSILSDYNGGIEDSNIAAGAGITPSKVSGTAVTLAGAQTMTNKTLTTPTLTSPVINTSVSGTAIKNENNMASDSATALASQQSIKAYVDSGTVTMTNKTLTKPTINGSVGAYTSDSDASTITFSMAASNVHTVTLGGNRTLALSNVSVGQAFVIRLVQDGTGSRTVTWFTTIKWAGGSAPTLTTTANKTDVFGFLCTSSGNYDGYIIGQNL
jgi:hypothetical protein